MTCGKVALWLGHLHSLAGFHFCCTLGGVGDVICSLQRSQLCICVWRVRGFHLRDSTGDMTTCCTQVDYCRGRGYVVFYRAASSYPVMRGASFHCCTRRDNSSVSGSPRGDPCCCHFAACWAPLIHVSRLATSIADGRLPIVWQEDLLAGNSEAGGACHDKTIFTCRTPLSTGYL